MSADVIQIRDFQSPRELARLAKAAVESTEAAFVAEFGYPLNPVAFNAALPVWLDYSQAGGFHSPDKDSA